MSQEHSFANPGPAGLGALAMACFTFYAVFAGKVDQGALPLLACWLFGGFIVQLIVGLIELKDHNLTGGNVFTFFAAFFMFTAALSCIMKYIIIQGVAPGEMTTAILDGRIEGWGWLAGTGFLIAMTPSYLKSTKLLFLVAVLLDVALICITCIDLKIVTNVAMFKAITSWMLLISGIIAIYLAAAVATNTNFGRTILPLPAPFVK